jgi:hypothetical protein
MSNFRIVPRSALYGQPTVDQNGTESMPAAYTQALHAGRGTSVNPAHPALVRIQALQQALAKAQADKQRIVKLANQRLSALMNRIQQLEGFVRTGYAPGAQAEGGQGPGYDVGVPTHTLRNPYLRTVDGARGAPPAQASHTPAGNPRDAASSPGTGAQTVEASVRQAEDAIFYGRGDAAFYEGGENDE